MESALSLTLLDAVARTIIDHADELTALDRAIGDGDHGLNMKRGFEAVLAQRATLEDAAMPDLLKAVGTTLVMKVGGASGPLFGTLFLTLGRQWPPTPKAAELAAAFRAAIDALMRLGKSQPGQKTMLDVLVPVHEELARGGDGMPQRLRHRAAAAAAATVPMLAIKGRASFLGERSIGHMDPGARSSCLIVTAVCDTLEA